LTPSKSLSAIRVSLFHQLIMNTPAPSKLTNLFRWMVVPMQSEQVIPFNGLFWLFGS
jgi:hypothetical protein